VIIGVVGLRGFKNQFPVRRVNIVTVRAVLPGEHWPEDIDQQCSFSLADVLTPANEKDSILLPERVLQGVMQSHVPSSSGKATPEDWTMPGGQRPRAQILNWWPLCRCRRAEIGRLGTHCAVSLRAGAHDVLHVS
jgi:hypothetical protein